VLSSQSLRRCTKACAKNLSSSKTNSPGCSPKTKIWSLRWPAKRKECPYWKRRFQSWAPGSSSRQSSWSSPLKFRNSVSPSPLNFNLPVTWTTTQPTHLSRRWRFSISQNYKIQNRTLHSNSSSLVNNWAKIQANRIRLWLKPKR